MQAPFGLQEIADLQTEVMMHASHQSRIVPLEPDSKKHQTPATEEKAPKQTPADTK